MCFLSGLLIPIATIRLSRLPGTNEYEHFRNRGWSVFPYAKTRPRELPLTSNLVARTAAIRYPHIDVDIWGPKWKHWDPELTVSENVRRRGWKPIERWPSKEQLRKEGKRMWDPT